MKYQQPQALYEFLSEYLTDNRKELFEKVLKYRTRHFVVAVEDLHKEQNASAVVRSCDCFGIQELHIVQENNPYQVSRNIAMGAENWLDIHLYDEYEDNVQTCIDELKSRGYKIVATSPHRQGKMLEDFDISQPAVLFFGGEKAGLSQKVLDQADEYMTIPIVGFTESFNISVSAAIILHELTQKLRKLPEQNWAMPEEAKLQKKLEWAVRTIKRGEEMAAYFYKNKQ